MKVLMWQHNGENLVCVDLEYTKTGWKDKDGNKVQETNIADIFRDTRKNYVICSACGKLVKNTPQDIEDHWKERASQKNCLICNELREGYRKKEIKRTYKQDPENPNKYISTYKYSVELSCSYNGNINDENVVETYCKYLKCKNSDKYEVDDFFTKYPHAFGTLVTVDKLVENKWVHDSVYRNRIRYHHPKMSTLKADVNEKGIVCGFYLTSNSYEAIYSEKYDKLFFKNNGRYCIRNVFGINEDRLESYTNKIKELFN